MKHLSRIGSLLLASALTLSVVYQQPAQGHRSLPQETYHRAWQLVRDNYYDSQFNHRDWSELEHKFDNSIKTNEDAYKYIKVMLEGLNDPYTRLLEPRAFQDENDAIDARIVGIGINLQQSKETKHLVVTRTIEDGPAETAGIRAGDEITAIDGLNAIGMTPEQAAEHIRGKQGTPVQVAVSHAGVAKTVSITRQEITIHAVSSKMLDNGIGYIQLSTFISNDASREFRQALQKLSNADGIVLDLRDNPGGLLSNALEIADMLLDNGAIVSTISRHGHHTDLSSGDPLTHQPIVVLVDDESASASEILASALKDNGRGVLIGTRTYGKGLVQEINRLPGGAAIHVTVSRYLTPSGSDINKVGVLPDVNETDKERQFQKALVCLKEKIATLKPTLGNNKPISSMNVLRTQNTTVARR